MVHGKNRISYWIDRRLTGLAGPEYDVAISLGLPCEPEDCQYGESRLRTGSADSLRVQAHSGGVVRIVAQLATVVAYDGAHDPLI